MIKIPKTAVYMAKQKSDLSLIIFSIKRMAKYPTTAALNVPAITSIRPASLSRGIELPDIISIKCRTKAPSIAGMDNRKEKRAARSLESFLPRAPVIVAPERETPGKMAIACINPTVRASRQVIESNCFKLFSLFIARRERISALHNKQAVNKNEKPNNLPSKNKFSIDDLNIRAMIIVGIVPIIKNNVNF